MNTVKFKVDMVAEIKDIQKALKKRGITVNQANTNRFIKLIQQGSFSLNFEFYEDTPQDRETLLMYGFTFDKKEDSK